MLENIEKIIKKFEKINGYKILKEEKEHLIVGTKILIVELQVKTGNIFSPPHETKIKKELPIFFLVSFTKKAAELDKYFLSQNLPILQWPLNKKKMFVTENIQQIVDNFIDMKFGH